MTLCKALEIDPNYLLGWTGGTVDATATVRSESMRLAMTFDKLPQDIRDMLTTFGKALIAKGYGLD